MVLHRRPASRSRLPPPRFASSGARLPIRDPHGTTRSPAAGVRRVLSGLLLAALVLGAVSSSAHDRPWPHRHTGFGAGCGFSFTAGCAPIDPPDPDPPARPVPENQTYGDQHREMAKPQLREVTIHSTPVRDATCGVGEWIRVLVRFDRPVTVSGNPTLKIDIGRVRTGCVSETLTPTARIVRRSATHETLVSLAARQPSSPIVSHVTSMRITVPTVDDDMLEPDETFTVHIVPDWTGVEQVRATATIIDDDDSARARALEVMLASFGRTVASEAVNVVEERFADARAGSSVTLGGQRLPLGTDAAALVPGAPGAERNSLSAREALSQSAFAVSFGSPDESGPDVSGGWMVWGRMGRSGFSGRPERDLSAEGDVSSGYLGLDARMDDDLLLGMALSFGVALRPGR